MHYDLHSHSTASDGTLSPTALVERAAAQGVDALALTDHDSTAGLAEARAAAEAAGIRLVNGVEISVTWAGRTIHVCGLNVDPDNAGLQAGLASIREERERRATRMGEKLEKIGVKDAERRARAMATGGLVARTHYGRLLVQDGYEDELGKAIRKYLINGKAGFVAGAWAPLDDVVGWIRGAGGNAVIAHPARYDLTATKLRALVNQFIAAGGEGIEVISGSHTSDDARNMAEVARRHGLLASRGSDYHGPENPWIELGRLPPLPADLTPVWTRWS
ncbi:MAG: PHP domain-containing protein [Chromatiales bacterium]|nr:PHP domain-containing protein [Gammaproteobacteria bacterium]MCP5352636.1 PHP domain-containing protein [Chromatiales bacterium]